MKSTDKADERARTYANAGDGGSIVRRSLVTLGEVPLSLREHMLIQLHMQPQVHVRACDLTHIGIQAVTILRSG